MPSDEELLALLFDLESDRVERKERLAGDASTKLREAICAFANDMAGHRLPGVAIVGARDNGTWAEHPVDDQLLLSLADMKGDGNIQPLPTMRVERRILGGNPYAVVVVTPSDQPPVRFKGRVYIRVGPRRAIATVQDERILSERRRTGDLPFDMQPVYGASLADFDLRIFADEYLPSAFAPDVLVANRRTQLEQLASLRMIQSADKPIPTVFGMMVLAARVRDYVGGAYIQFLRLDGTALASPVLDSEEISGTLGAVVRRLDDKLAASNHIRSEFTTQSQEVRIQDYPLAALQQITRNALMHRNYEGTNAPIRVTWFSDRIEVLSPGGPYGQVNVANFGRAGVTDYRNRALAEAMKTMGFVQRFGVGIATAQDYLIKNGNPPLEWVAEDTCVQFTLRKRA